jgi:hypothetical protein
MAFPAPRTRWRRAVRVPLSRRVLWYGLTAGFMPIIVELPLTLLDLTGHTPWHLIVSP